MAQHAAPTATPDGLAEFLDAVRRPLDYLRTLGPGGAARLQLSSGLAARGRALRGRLQGERQAALDRLCTLLDEFDRAAPDARAALAEECRTLLAHIAAPRRIEPPPEYHPSRGDLDAALARLDRPVQYATGVGPSLAPRLQKFGLTRVEDLLYHLPFRYEDRRQVCDIASAVPGEEAGIVGELVQIAERNVGRSRRRILEGVLRDATGLLGLVWYHHVTHFRTRYRAGTTCRVYGRIERSPGGGKRIVHPEVELASEGGVGVAIVPVYAKPTTMKVGTMRNIVRRAVADRAADVAAVIPAPLAERARLMDPASALRALHLPNADADVDALNRCTTTAHRSLVFDELFFFHLGLALKRRQMTRERGVALPAAPALRARLRAAFPYRLTGAQERVLAEIDADLARPHPMRRLVQGDVGSGKTIVALLAALVAIEHGQQAAFMAPTELLAEQHHATIARLSEPLGIRVALLSGGAQRGRRGALLAALADGEVDLAVGTHALIQAGVCIPRLALGIIDEQHRFGVLQRAALAALRGAADGPVPHILLMSATPIPRTLAMTIYSDLDVSLLDELPPGRQPVRTVLVNEASRRALYEQVHAHLARGRQAYIVYPLVEASEQEALRDATTMANELARTVFAEQRVGLLHGRLKADEKDAVMRRFRAGDLQVLVSTTVIEVGVDVPNATVMVIEHADRFGLSQLHQLRGRVGRGSGDAVCFLVAPHLRERESETYQRLRVMQRTTDGFAIAEADLTLRGAGDFLGTRQHGLPDFRVANLIRDTRVLAEAREAAEHWLTLDPELRTPESAALRRVLEHRWQHRLGLAEIG